MSSKPTMPSVPPREGIGEGGRSVSAGGRGGCDFGVGNLKAEGPGPGVAARRTRQEDGLNARGHFYGFVPPSSTAFGSPRERRRASRCGGTRCGRTRHRPKGKVGGRKRVHRRPKREFGRAWIAPCAGETARADTMPKVAGTMDLEPIYCAEQIQVPPSWRASSRRTRRRWFVGSPRTSTEFSAIYFSNLASVSASTREETVPPTTAQLKEVYASCKGNLEMSLGDLVIECTGVGIKMSTVEQAFRLEEFQGDVVNPKEPLALLLTMTDASFIGIVASMFEVFGDDEKLPGAEFMSLFKYLTSKDTSVRSESIAAMDEALGSLDAVSFGEVNNVGAFQDIVDGAA